MEPERRAELRARYTRWTRFPLFVVGIVFIVCLVLHLDPYSSPEERAVAHALSGVCWFLLAADFAFSWWLSPRRRTFLEHNALAAVAVVVPPLRVLMVTRAFAQIPGASRLGFMGRARILAAYLTVMLVAVGAALVLYFERSNPHANIRSFGDSLWWTLETVSTVGYGDYYPVTVMGRVVAVVLFINGIALLSVITATIASLFLERDDSGRTTDLGDLAEALARIEARLGDAGTEGPAGTSGSVPSARDPE